MRKIIFLHLFLWTLMTISCIGKAFSCSMYKVSANGKTMVGNNEDSWGRDARIWFEQGSAGKFGVVCVGYARKQPHPDGAMNEHGLVFDAFTMPHKSNIPGRDPHKKDFAYAHIKTIMQQCKTVDEVHTFLAALNLHVLNGSPIFNGGMLLFVDKTGKYLVVEVGKMTLGNDDKFALANFSIADTKDLSMVKTERYRKGIAFLNNKPADTQLSYCTALSDTMSVRRAKVGDGTLYTSIYDLEAGLVHLYFFHDFSKRVTFNLKEELAKGDHAYDLSTIFPGNQQYQKFIAYQTPQNSRLIFIFILAAALLFFFSAVFFFISSFRASHKRDRYLKLGLAALSIAFCSYAYVLLRNEGIFYFPSPYVDRTSGFVSLTAYLPFLLLIVMAPLLLFMVRLFRQKRWSGFARCLLVLNNCVYLVLIGLFMYWQLFNLFP